MLAKIKNSKFHGLQLLLFLIQSLHHLFPQTTITWDEDKLVCVQKRQNLILPSATYS